MSQRRHNVTIYIGDYAQFEVEYLKNRRVKPFIEIKNYEAEWLDEKVHAGKTAEDVWNREEARRKIGELEKRERVY